jgi:hypothetical protein
MTGRWALIMTKLTDLWKDTGSLYHSQAYAASAILSPWEKFSKYQKLKL